MESMQILCHTSEGSVALEVQFHHGVAKTGLGLPALAFQADSSAETSPWPSAPPAAHPPAEKIVQSYSFDWPYMALHKSIQRKDL